MKSERNTIMVGSLTSELIKLIYRSLLTSYQEKMVAKMESTDFFDYVDRLYHRCHKVSLNYGGTYIDCPK